MSEPEHPILTRKFEAEIVDVSEGRTVEARIVPYNRQALVVDPVSDAYTQAGQPYEEMFLPGAFEHQLRAVHRVKVFLNFEHQQNISAILGRGKTFEERDDGLYGAFHVYDDDAGNKALRLIRDGMLTGLSVEFAALKSRVQAGVVQRVRAALDKVALCRVGAYEGAEILAVRTPPPLVEPPMLEPIDEQLAVSLRAYGVRIPGDTSDQQH